MAQPQRQVIAQGPVQPAFQQPPAHGRRGGIQHGQQAVGFPAPEVLFEFQVAAGDGIENEAVRTEFDLDRLQVQQCRALDFIDVLKERPRGRGGGRQPGKAQTFQFFYLVLPLDGVPGPGWIEMPRIARRYIAAGNTRVLLQSAAFAD